jgi:hypothetical protein
MNIVEEHLNDATVSKWDEIDAGDSYEKTKK